MEKDYFSYVKWCHKCQEHRNLIHTPVVELHANVPIWMFSVWGLDLIGKISPPSSVGHTFIITATNYFTKWVEAIPLHSIIAKVICRFILEYIISHFRLPFAIVSNNGTPFKNSEVQHFLATFNIQHRFSTPYYLQSNIKLKIPINFLNISLRKLFTIIIKTSMHNYLMCFGLIELIFDHPQEIPLIASYMVLMRLCTWS